MKHIILLLLFIYATCLVAQESPRLISKVTEDVERSYMQRASYFYDPKGRLDSICHYNLKDDKWQKTDMQVQSYVSKKVSIIRIGQSGKVHLKQELSYRRDKQVRERKVTEYLNEEEWQNYRYRNKYSKGKLIETRRFDKGKSLETLVKYEYDSTGKVIAVNTFYYKDGKITSKDISTRTYNTKNQLKEYVETSIENSDTTIRKRMLYEYNTDGTINYKYQYDYHALPTKTEYKYDEHKNIIARYSYSDIGNGSEPSTAKWDTEDYFVEKFTYDMGLTSKNNRQSVVYDVDELINDNVDNFYAIISYEAMHSDGMVLTRKRYTYE